MACGLSQAQVVKNFPITGTSDSPKIQTFDRNMVNFMKRWNLPGAALVVMKNGKVTTARGYGWADMQSRTEVMPNDLFRIASTSKTFTAVTVLKLIQEGKLNLNDKVFDILNDLKPLNGRSINPQIYQITVQNLLQMSSGWFNPGAGHFDPMFGPWPQNFLAVLSPELPASCETTTRYMMSQPLRHKPGTTYVYSNMDYCILGLVINKVTGTPYGYKGYENYVKSQILAPIGIHDMVIGSTQQKYRLPNEVTYYRPPGGITPQELANSFYLPYSNMEILRKNFGNGGWLASAYDLATFIQALKHFQILNSRYLGIMQTKPAFVPKNKMTYYTMGGIISNLPGETDWIQTGSFTGTNAFILSRPDDTTIAVIFNSRPNAYAFLSRTRPELKRLLMNSGL
ncbi:MAG TPA: serine hydrolase domain-containing protein [Gammaproteobacteria bacterium]|nr:serine hydrolase domain-containing protein [Gammaproteobacteria bacterium]